MNERQGPPDIEHIEETDLRDNGRLAQLYVQAVERGYWRNSTGDMLEFAAFAQKALADDTQGTPGRLFYSLVKAKDGSTVTNEAERLAMERFPSPVRQDLVDAAADVAPRARQAATREAVEDTLAGREIGYVHSVFIQCFLPQRPTDQFRWRTTHGRASLSVEAGSLANPDRPNEWLDCAVPSGPKPRLIIPYIVGEAIRNGHPEVDLGHSLRDFMSRLGVPVTGHNGKALTREVQNVAAARVLVGEWTADAVHTHGGQIAKRVSFWLERDPAQPAFWTPTMTLSDDFHAAIQEHRVPLDMGHLARLARSPRRMDLYAWLSYRTPRIAKRGRVAVPLDSLQAIFAPDIASSRLFKSRLKTDLKAIADVYSGFNASVDGDILSLRRSPPPIPFAARLTLPTP